MSAGKAVFLSYAREDIAVARRIAEALRASGVEVWFDENELRGGDAWDQKIRSQIKECTLFMPVISAGTQARTEGYFRREWRMAVERTRDMADDAPFLVPVVIDDTPDGAARVPECFRERQWTRLRQASGGQALDDPSVAVFCQRVRTMLTGDLGARTPSSAPESQRPAAAAFPAAPSRNRPGRGIAIVCAGALAAGVAIWQPWRPRGEEPAANSARTASSPTANEVAQLRARLIPETWRNEDFEPWSVEIDRLIAADDRNADAWALRSIINSLQVMRHYEAGTRPLEIGRSAAQRARLLSPDSALAELALGLHLTAMISRGGDPTAPRPHLNRALAKIPPDPLTRYADLAGAFNAFDFPGLERAARAWLTHEPSAPYPAFIQAQMHLALRNYSEVVRWTDRGVSASGDSGMRTHGVAVAAEYFLRGNLETTRAALDRIPTEFRSTHRIIYWCWLLAMAERRWDVALQELARTPETVFYEGTYYGPKALLAGLAHQAAGRDEPARAQFREAERVGRELLTRDPQNERLHAVQALTLACAGRRDEARTELAMVEPLLRGRPRTMYIGSVMSLLAHTHAVLGQLEPMVFWLREMLSGPTTAAFTPACLRIDPRFQGVIATPQMQALLADFAHLDAERTASKPPAEKSVAVLAFENRSSEKDSEYFSDGISEELLNVLAKVPGLRVVGRASSFQFKGRKESPANIAKQLNVTYLVDGSVQRVGTRARITAELTLAATGATLWSDKFDTELKDIFAAQDDIALLIAKKLSLPLGSGPPPIG